MTVRARSQSPGGFTLVEITLAIGLAAFALISVIGLLPIGIDSVRHGRMQDLASEVLATVATDLRATPSEDPESPHLQLLLSGTAPQTRYFNFYGQTTDTLGEAVLIMQATPLTSPRPGALAWHLAASWPPQNPKGGGTAETVLIHQR